MIMVKPFLINTLYCFSFTVVMRMIVHAIGLYEVSNSIASIFSIAICSVIATLLMKITDALKPEAQRSSL
jgi:hypothetical protein